MGKVVREVYLKDGRVFVPQQNAKSLHVHDEGVVVKYESGSWTLFPWLSVDKVCGIGSGEWVR